MADDKIVHIKHMVCPRCIATVGRIFDQLNIPIERVVLGEVTVSNQLKPTDRLTLQRELLHHGFELLEDNERKLVNKVKSYIIDKIHFREADRKLVLSEELAKELHRDYSSISRLFAKVEGITIERFLLSQRIEKVKELLSYQELTISEIAFKLNYSSAAHLSSQFKKATGMSPSAFKKLHRKPRKSIASI